MIEIRFEEREKIGLQYILESLHGCSPFGQERIRRLRYYTPDQRQELELELYNVERAAAHAEELKDLYDQICVVLCQMKDIRGSLRRCRELEVPDHVELFELKGYLQRLETLRPMFERLRDVDPEQIRRELAATNEDGVAVIARHMNYGLYRVEGRSDCPRDALNICRMLSLKPEILEKIEQSY